MAGDEPELGDRGRGEDDDDNDDDTPGACLARAMRSTDPDPNPEPEPEPEPPNVNKLLRFFMASKSCKFFIAILKRSSLSGSKLIIDVGAEDLRPVARLKSSFKADIEEEDEDDDAVRDATPFVEEECRLSASAGRISILNILIIIFMKWVIE